MMNSGILQLLLFAVLLIGCRNNKTLNTGNGHSISVIEVSFLIDSLYRVDQEIQHELSKEIGQGNSNEVAELLKEEKAIFRRHIPILKRIYKEFGYPTRSRVGKKTSGNFFTLIQHSDADVNFQKEMLAVIKDEMILGNVGGKDYAFLVDRVALSTGQEQTYGTQITYNTNNARAIPKALKEPHTVNSRRAEVGLELLEEYLNKASMIHFEMNKDRYNKMGILEPNLYEVPQFDFDPSKEVDGMRYNNPKRRS